MTYLIAWISTIVLANWFIGHVGDCSGVGPCTVPVWFGIAAPSGVLWVGVAFTLRDLTQDALGRRATLLAIVAGSALSALISPGLALASGLSFLFSEGVDFAVYTPLRERHWLLAVAASNIFGLTVDSLIFLYLAFGSLQFLEGQVIGKLEMTVLALCILIPLRHVRAAGLAA